MSSSSRSDDRRYSSSRRDSSQSSYSSRRDRDRDSSRRSSPGPSRGRSPPPPAQPRDPNELPVEFGRPMEPTSKEDENTVWRRMTTAFTNSPLRVINDCVEGNKKIKVWTRNFKEVRGICMGLVVAFDKHWNLVLSDVEEVYIKPKKAKTPFLQDVTPDDLKEIPPRVPKVKKTPEEKEAAAAEAAAKKAEEGTPEDEAKKAKREQRKKKKKGRKVHKRVFKQLFVRGDNLVMCTVLDSEESPEDPED